jgi:sorting nexin-1/2
VRQALSASTSDLAAAVASLAALTHALPRPVRDALSALAALKRRVHELEEQQQAAETSEASLVMTTEAHIRLCTSIRLAAVARLKCYANWQRALSTAQSLRGQHDRARQRGAPPYPDAIHELSETDRRAEDAKREFEDVSKLFKAEMVRFDAEKVDDFRIALISHIDGLIVRQKQVQRRARTLHLAD